MNIPVRLYRGRKILLLTTAVFMSCISEAGAVDNLTTPSGEVVQAGSATFDRPEAGTLNINQNSDRVVIDWDRFDIGTDATTSFRQPRSDSLAVNRVTGDKDDPSQILGTLKANGNVMVLDRNGVFFGKDSTIDVNGIIASTGTVTNTDVMNGGKLTIKNIDGGTIENQGTITAAEAGLVGFVAPNVKNAGVINAKLGKVALASGSKATVDLFGDGLVELAVGSTLENAYAENSGKIFAESGNVQITTRVARDIVDNSINMNGVIDVSSVRQQAGKIILSGAQDTTVSGKLLAGGHTGGDITIESKEVGIADKGELQADGSFTGEESGAAQSRKAYTGGVIKISAPGSVNATGKISTNGEEGGGSVRISAGDNVNVANIVEARSTGTSKGGLIDISSRGDETRIASRLDTSGIDEGGDIHVSAKNILTLTEDSSLISRTLSTGKGGDIRLEGGEIAADGLINVNGKEGGGLVRADSDSLLRVGGDITSIGEVVGRGGNVLLNAGTDFFLDSLIYADGRSGGGRVSINGDNILTSSASRISAQGLDSGLPDFPDNPGGSIALTAANILNSAGSLNASGYNGGGGTIKLGGESVDVSGRIDAQAKGSGKGGEVRITSEGELLNLTNIVNVSGIDGGGKIKLSQDNPDLNENTALYVRENARLVANALSTGKGGSIRIDGVNTEIKGNMSANGPAGGGSITVNAYDTSVFGKIDALATQSGKGGKITLENEGDLTIIGQLNAGGADKGGQIKLSGDDVFVQPESILYSRSADGKGGNVLLDATGDVNVQGLINVNGSDGGGLARLTAGFVRLSGDVYASATGNGDGGRVLLEGKSSNDFSGTIIARGGPVSGDGGFVKFNRPNTIANGSIVNVSAPNGDDGTFLY
jgi:filamentous hemagglutinin family protein